MANPWFRLWSDMVNDPKWRTIAKISGQEISRVIAVYLHMMTCASNATERGRTQGWCDEDVASALDVNINDIVEIREAMQGRVLDGDYLSGWSKRQPKREDGAAERSKNYREAKKQDNSGEKQQQTASRTQPNATERKNTLEEIREEEKREEDKKIERTPRATRLPQNWEASDACLQFCKTERPDLDPAFMQNKFRDYWHGIGGKGGTKLDWEATWRNFVRSERSMPQARGSPSSEFSHLGKAGQETAMAANRLLEKMRLENESGN